MNKEKYFEFCRLQEIEPDPRAIPLDLTDFPEIVAVAISIFNGLRDTFIPGEIPQYSGKDITGLPILFDIYEITDTFDKQLILRTINILDGAARLTAQKEIERARKKATKGKPSLPDVEGGSRVK